MSNEIVKSNLVVDDVRWFKSYVLTNNRAKKFSDKQLADNLKLGTSINDCAKLFGCFPNPIHSRIRNYKIKYDIDNNFTTDDDILYLVSYVIVNNRAKFTVKDLREHLEVSFKNGKNDMDARKSFCKQFKTSMSTVTKKIKELQELASKQ